MSTMYPCQDATIFQEFFKEAASLMGITVKYSYVTNIQEKMDVTIYTEWKPLYSDPMEIDVILEENPKVATLNAIGWISEDPKDKPYIVRLPFDTPNLSAYAKITMPTFGNPLIVSERDFEITSINIIQQYPDCWVCTIAPIMIDDKTVSKNYDDSNYNYVKSKDTPDNDTPLNKRLGSRNEENFSIEDEHKKPLTVKDKNFEFFG